VDGLIEDINGLHYTVHASNGTVFAEGSAEQIHDSRTYSSFQRANGDKPDITPPNSDFHISGVTGPLAEIFNRNGPVSLRLSAYDRGGFQQCIDRSFIFDGLVELDALSVSRKIFSPNGDQIADEVEIQYSLSES